MKLALSSSMRKEMRSFQTKDAIRSFNEAAMVLKEEKASLFQALELESSTSSLVFEASDYSTLGCCNLASAQDSTMLLEEPLNIPPNSIPVAIAPPGTPPDVPEPKMDEESKIVPEAQVLSDQEGGLLTFLQDLLGSPEGQSNKLEFWADDISSWKGKAETLEATKLNLLEENRHLKDQVKLQANSRTMTTALVGQVQQLMSEKEEHSTASKKKIDCLTKDLNAALSNTITLKNEIHYAKRNQENKVLSLNKELECTKEALKEKDKELENVKDNLENVCKQGEEYQAKLTQSQLVCKSNKVELETRMRLEHQRKKEAARSAQRIAKILQDRISQLEVHSTRMNNELESTKKSLKAKDDALKSTKLSFKEKNDELESTNETLQEQNSKVTIYKLALKETNLELKSNKEALKEKNIELTSAKEAVKVRDEKLVSIKAVLQEKNVELESTKEALNEKNNKLNSTMKALNDKNNALKSTKKTLKAKGDSLVITKGVLKSTTKSLKSLEKEKAKIAALWFWFAKLPLLVVGAVLGLLVLDLGLFVLVQRPLVTFHDYSLLSSGRNDALVSSGTEGCDANGSWVG